MLFWIIAIFVGILVLFGILIVIAPYQRSDEVKAILENSIEDDFTPNLVKNELSLDPFEESHEQITKHKLEIRKKEKVRFQTEIMENLPFKVGIESNRCVAISINKDNNYIIISRYELNDGIYKNLTKETIDIKEILKATIEEDIGTENYIEKNTISVSEVKNKNVIGRAVVGGIALGPAGAIVGAISGTNPNVTTNLKTVNNVRQRDVVKGYRFCIYQNMDSGGKITRVNFSNKDDATILLLELENALSS